MTPEAPRVIYVGNYIVKYYRSQQLHRIRMQTAGDWLSWKCRRRVFFGSFPFLYLINLQKRNITHVLLHGDDRCFL